MESNLFWTCVFMVFVLWSSPNHTPIKHRSSIKETDRLTPTYLMWHTIASSVFCNLNMTFAYADHQWWIDIISHLNLLCLSPLDYANPFKKNYRPKIRISTEECPIHRDSSWQDTEIKRFCFCFRKWWNLKPAETPSRRRLLVSVCLPLFFSVRS